MRPKGTIEKDCYQDLRVQTAALTEYRVQNTEYRAQAQPADRLCGRGGDKGKQIYDKRHFYL